MRRFRVNGTVTVGCFTEVYATDEADAIRKASKLAGHVILVIDKAPGGNEWEDGFFIEGEGDGIPTELQAEECEDEEGEE